MALFRFNEDACEDQACGTIGLDNDAKKGLYLADEYDDDEEKLFVGAGEEKETSKINIPAALAAKTAGGVAFDQTEVNGVNGVHEAYTRKETVQVGKSVIRHQLKKMGLKPNNTEKRTMHNKLSDHINKYSDSAFDRANKVADSKAARNRAKYFAKN